MAFTDLFIRKPVLATVVSLIVLVLGMRSLFGLSVRQFPKTENATITVTTTYYGANSDVIAGFITAPTGKRDRASAGHRLPDLKQSSPG
jgi:multidrug efflux pump